MRDLVSIKTQIAEDYNPQGRKSNQKLISCVTPPSITAPHQLYDPRFSCLTVCINKKVTCAFKTKTRRGKKMEELKAWSWLTTGRQRMIGSRHNISGRNISLKSLTGRERVSIMLLQKVLPTMQSSITCFCSTRGPAPLCYTTHICLIWDNSLRHHSTVTISTFYSLIHVRP